MSSEISRKIQNIMAREMGHLGKFIVEKQCKNLGFDVDDIKEEELPQLAKVLGGVMKTFGGEDKARKLEFEIRKIT